MEVGRHSTVVLSGLLLPPNPMQAQWRADVQLYQSRVQQAEVGMAVPPQTVHCVPCFVHFMARLNDVPSPPLPSLPLPSPQGELRSRDQEIEELRVSEGTHCTSVTVTTCAGILCRPYCGGGRLKSLN